MTKLDITSPQRKSKFERNPIKTWILLIFILFLFIISVIAILEIYCGYKYYKYRDNIRNTSRAIRLRENYPNSNIKMSGSKFGKKDVSFRIDSNGYVSLSGIHNDPDIKIFFVGGSTTECMFVDEDKRFPYYTGKLLEKEFQKKINTYNSGVSGNNSLHSINILINKILPEKPDYVVFMHNINDIATLMHTGTYWNNNKSRSPIIYFEQDILTYSVRMPKNKFVRNFIPYIALVMLPATFEPECDEINIDEWSGSSNSTFIDTLEFMNEFKENISTFILICKTRNIRPIIMTQASNFSFDIKNKPMVLQNLHRKFNEIIRETANESDVLLIDLAKEFSDKGYYFFDQIHYNDSGSIAVSKFIVKNLSSEILKNN